MLGGLYSVLIKPDNKFFQFIIFQVRVHTTGALWNLSSHQAIKQSLLDQVLNDCVERVLLPYAEMLKRASKDQVPGFDQVFINVAIASQQN